MIYPLMKIYHISVICSASRTLLLWLGTLENKQHDFMYFAFDFQKYWKSSKIWVTFWILIKTLLNFEIFRDQIKIYQM